MNNQLLNENAYFIAEPSNLFYFTNINNSDAYLIFLDKKPYYFTDSRYFEECKYKLPHFNICNVNELEDFIKKNRIYELGIEDSLPQCFYHKLFSFGVKHTFGITKKLQKIRATKKPNEIELIRKAQFITDKTFTDILPMIKEGISEIELARILECLLYKNGADEIAFRSIVAFSENTSKPHAERTEKKLKNGSLITFDFGAKYCGYCSDMTRTIAFGNISNEQKLIYNHVLTAQELVLEKAITGLTAKECDSIARSYFDENGLSKYFLHSLGHGVGLDIHEYPGLSPKFDIPLEENMVVTIEPGLYFENKFGIRIEDLIIFDKTSIINLTKSPKNMIIL